MKRICIIGAGASGLPAIKSCLDENLIPVCYERSHDIGGLWRYEEEKEGSSVYKTTIINTAKELMCYSDFPIPKHFANFMHHSKVMEYFRLYAKEFNLLPHICFNTEVQKCEFADDYESSGRWKVTIKNRKDGEIRTEIFDGILVCIGHHAIPHYPSESFPGFNKFKGIVMHSRDYRDPLRFVHKRVVVIGIGNSGGDLAVEIGSHAEKVYLSTRRGAWVMNRVGPNGVPLGYIFSLRSLKLLNDILPSSWINYLTEKQLNERFDHAVYGLKPQHRAFSQHPLINDSLANSIVSGLVMVKGNVKEFTENGVIFEDGSSEEVDAVIFATGYRFHFPFLDDSVIKVKNNDCRLFRHVWPPHLQHSSLAVIGCIQPIGAINPSSEMQCRWATRVIKGDAALPQRSEMERIIDEDLDVLHKQYYKSNRHTMQVDYITYMDALADSIGAKPDIVKIFKEDFKLGWKMFFGPCTPYQYRLEGPGSWPKAREAIMTQDERILFPLSTRKVNKSKGYNWSLLAFAALIFLILAYVVWQII